MSEEEKPSAGASPKGGAVDTKNRWGKVRSVVRGSFEEDVAVGSPTGALSPARKRRTSKKIEAALKDVKTLGPVPLLGVVDEEGKQAWAAGATSKVLELWKKPKSSESVRARLERRMKIIARDTDAEHASEYTGATQSKTIAFHRRLERGLGAELFYEKNAGRTGSAAAGTPFKEIYETYKSAPVVIHAGEGLVWWRGHQVTLVRHHRMRGLTQCFALKDILGVEPVAGDSSGRTFAIKIARPRAVGAPFVGASHVADDAPAEPFELLFLTGTRGTCARLVAGFELLRRHHTQLFDEASGGAAAADGRDLERGAGSDTSLAREPSLGAGLGAAQLSTSKASFTPAERLGELSSKSAPGRSSFTGRRLSQIIAGTKASQLLPKAAHIAPSAWSQAAAVFEPRRDVGYQHYEQDISAKVVEVQYDAFAPGASGKVRLPDGSYFPVPTEHFCEGTWIVCTVDPEGFDEDENTYTLVYKDGPFEKVGEDNGLGVGVTIKIAQFPEGTTFEQVPRDDIQVDIWDQPTAGFPFFIVSITLIQVLLYVLYKHVLDTGHDFGGPKIMTLDAASGWPRCKDQRWQFWRYFGYQFVHASTQHITFNAVVQLMIGIPLELASGYRMAFVYETGVVFGALAAFTSDPTDMVVGASGGVYSLFGAHFGHTVLNFHELHRGFFNRWTRFFLLALFVAVDSGMAIATLSKEGHEASTSYAAHAGGFVAGLGFAFFGFEELVDHHGRVHKLRPVAAVLMLGLLIFMVAYIASADPIKGFHTPDREETYCCYQASYCSGFDTSDYDEFNCPLRGDDYVIWPKSRGHPPSGAETYSCALLSDFSKNN